MPHVLGLLGAGGGDCGFLFLKAMPPMRILEALGPAFAEVLLLVASPWLLGQVASPGDSQYSTVATEY